MVRLAVLVLVALLQAIWLPTATARQVSQDPPSNPSIIPDNSATPEIGVLDVTKLVWSTMIAVDHANQSGNYSVLRDMSAPGFQERFDSAALVQIFAPLRASGIDLSNTLLLAPTYSSNITPVRPGVIRVVGVFGLRPIPINFDLYFQLIGTRWKLLGVAIVPSPIDSVQPNDQSTNQPVRRPMPVRVP